MSIPSEGAITIEEEVHFNKYSNNYNRQYRNINFTQGPTFPPPSTPLLIKLKNATKSKLQSMLSIAKSTLCNEPYQL